MKKNKDLGTTESKWAIPMPIVMLILAIAFGILCLSLLLFMRGKGLIWI